MAGNKYLASEPASRSESKDRYSSRLQESEKTLAEMRNEHQEALAAARKKNQDLYAVASKKQIKALNKLEIAGAEEVARYKRKLAEETNLSEQQIQKKAAAYAKKQWKKETVEAKQASNAMIKWCSSQLNNLIGGLKTQFESIIKTYGTYQEKINTRLQGSGLTFNGANGISRNITKAVGSNAYVKLQAVMDNVVTATEAGIANNIEQRAFLATISENIASTFNAFDSNLLRIIRLQQSDSTAARLGLEGGLTSFLNSYFKDTSYLNSAFDEVSANLTEATSQMSSEDSVALEYIVQKWLGSLYSVGFSDSAVSSISQALGYLGSGDVSSLSGNSSMQNLMVMSANKAGLSYSKILTDGLNASDANDLLEAMVEYLAEIAQGTNNVVKSQYASVFGMSVSDLAAVSNLSPSVSSIKGSTMSYGGAMNELYGQMGQLSSRMSMSSLSQNMFENIKYAIGSGIASNVASYALWEITSMIEDLTGGINLPTMYFAGTGVDLDTTVTNLMRLGLVGASTLGNIGTIINGVSNTVDPTGMLSALGIANTNSASYFTRGSGLNRRKKGKSTSSSIYVGNTSGSDYYNAALTSANDTVATTISGKQAESTELTVSNIHEYLVSIFDPKITQMEQMLAALAGYSITTTSWGDFTSGAGSRYAGTNVQIKSADGTQTVAANAQLLSEIRDSSASILQLLKDVISGNSSLTVKQLGTSTSGVGI